MIGSSQCFEHAFRRGAADAGSVRRRRGCDWQSQHSETRLKASSFTCRPPPPQVKESRRSPRSRQGGAHFSGRTRWSGTRTRADVQDVDDVRDRGGRLLERRPCRLVDVAWVSRTTRSETVAGFPQAARHPSGDAPRVWACVPCRSAAASNSDRSGSRRANPFARSGSVW